jgi:hypothetical protein
MADETKSPEAMWKGPDERGRFALLFPDGRIEPAWDTPSSCVNAMEAMGPALADALCDNAALVDLLGRAAGVLRDLAGMPMEADLLSDTASEPHPGAALLEELRTLRQEQGETLEAMRPTVPEGMSLLGGVRWLAEQLANERAAHGSARAKVAALEEKTACTVGVGDGSGTLFVHGDHASVKAVQALVLENERMDTALEWTRGYLRRIGDVAAQATLDGYLTPPKAGVLAEHDWSPPEPHSGLCVCRRPGCGIRKGVTGTMWHREGSMKPWQVSKDVPIPDCVEGPHAG